MENWIIVHDNGIPGQKGYTDGYTSESETVKAVEEYKACGITVYYYWKEA